MNLFIVAELTLIDTIRDNRRNDDLFNDPRNPGKNASAIVNAQPGTVVRMSLA